MMSASLLARWCLIWLSLRGLRLALAGLRGLKRLVELIAEEPLDRVIFGPALGLGAGILLFGLG
jgi:hypothetical protein